VTINIGLYEGCYRLVRRRAFKLLGL